MDNLRYAICYNKEIENSLTVKDKLLTVLQEKNLTADVIDIDNLKNGYDFVFVIGGDGTILKTARFYAKAHPPVFGINLGRLGFLSQASKEDLKKSVEKILNNEFHTEERIMLESNNYLALNDIVIKGALAGRTSSFSLKINGKPLCDYLADGIIIATPTGSTAYGLSAGGPVVSPHLNAFVIVPICPHTLTARPLVIPDDEKITICGTDPNSKYLFSADGQEFSEFKNEIEIKKSNYRAKLALLDDSDFYSILKNKLHWGISPACIENCSYSK